MRGTLSTLGLLILASGCTTTQFTKTIDGNTEVIDGTIRGRVCDTTGRSWLSDALAYTNIRNEAGKITDVRKSYTDRDGYWALTDLTAEQEYLIYVQHGTQVLETHEIYLPSGATIQLRDPPCFDPAALNIALVLGDYDDIDRVLADMGFANFTLIDGTRRDVLRDWLVDLPNLQQFDIVFFNGGHQEQGIFYDVDPSNRVPEIVRENLQTYVEGGGSVYASDWSYDVVETTWPDALDFYGDDRKPNAAQVGEYGVVRALVEDGSLAKFLGKDNVQIEYDLPVWAPIMDVQEYVSVHLRGNINFRDGTYVGTVSMAPLLVSFSVGEGTVAYSTFRVAANNSPDMVLILQYMMGEL